MQSYAHWLRPNYSGRPYSSPRQRHQHLGSLLHVNSLNRPRHADDTVAREGADFIEG